MYVMLVLVQLLLNTSSCFSCFPLDLQKTSLATYVQYCEVMTVSSPAFAGWKNANLH